jgi:3-phenylpropionate/trans-cinnamate dioxygenase ferredoxin reductase component
VTGRTFVVVGASLTGATAAATLRERGFDGRLVVIGDEPDLPYERPGLSKRYLRGELTRDELTVRPEAWWKEHDVDLRLGTTVERVDPADRSVTVVGGDRIAFDAALVATGVRNRRIHVPGIELDGVFQLRRVGDADTIRERASKHRRAVVVGMGFIGAEVAASLRVLGLDVTVVGKQPTAMFSVLGLTLGRLVEAMHRDHGVEVITGDTISSFDGAGSVEAARTEGGRTIPCDLVVVGVGTEPNVEAMAGAGVDPIGGITVDASLRTPLPGVFAAGDIAAHDHPVFGPVFGRIRVEHYDNALRTGAHVAGSMLGSTEPFDDPHWFWSDQFETEIQMGGVRITDDMVVRGSLEDRRFCAFFLDGAGVLRASLSMDWPRDVRRSLQLIRAGVAPDRAALVDPSVDLRTLDPARA